MKSLRNTGTRGYTGYRGRGRGGRGPLIALLAVVLLAACAFLFAQRYVVFASDGSFHFEWPWTKQEQTAEKPPAAPSSAVSQPPAEVVIERIEPDPADEPEPLAVSETHALALPSSVLQGGTERALDQIENGGFNAFSVLLKNVHGELLYPSQLRQAKEAGAVTGGSIALAALEELLGTEYHSIARIHTLHDSVFSFAHMSDAAVQQIQYSGYIWYAPDSSFFLAPEKELTRQYVAAVAGECAALGFDELLFDDFTYPWTGRLSNIKTDRRTMTKEEALSALAAAIREAVAEYDVKLSISLDAETVLSGANEARGQNVAQLASYFDRVYVAAPEEQLPALRAALAPYDVELVAVVSQPVSGGAYLLVE